MANNTLKTFIFASTLALFGEIIPSCNKTDKTQSKQPVKQTTESKSAYFDQIRDSVRNKNGYAIYKSQLELSRSVDCDKEDIQEISKQLTLGGFMTNKVKTEGVKILNSGYNQIVSMLGKEKIYLDDIIDSDSDEFRIYQEKDTEHENIVCLSKSNMVFVGTESQIHETRNTNVWVLRETRYAFDSLTSAIKDAIDATNYAVNKKRALKAQVVSDINKIQFDLQHSRHKIEKQYSDYYLLNDYDKKMLGININVFGYDNLNRPETNGKYCVTHRCVGLNVNKPNNTEFKHFLQDSMAQYIAVNNGNKSYNIIKTSNNGDSITKTVFCNKTKGACYKNVTNSQPDRNIVDFEFELDTCDQVMLYFDEIIDIVSRKKDWHGNLSKDAQYKIDSLNDEIQRKNKLLSLVVDTERCADSIANAIVEQKFNGR